MTRGALAGTTVTAPELLERSEQLAALAENLEAVTVELRGRLVLVRGEAGVGKTTLLRRFCEGRNGTGRVLWGNCDPLFTPRPLGPLFALSELQNMVAHDVLPHEVVAALAEELRRRAPTVFVLEDLHWADEATLGPPLAELWLLEARGADELGCLDECLASGMLIPGAGGVASRHELARLAGEDSISPMRKLELHRKALDALAKGPATRLALAR